MAKSIELELPDGLKSFADWQEVQSFAAEEADIWEAVTKDEKVAGTTRPIFSNSGVAKLRDSWKRWADVRDQASTAEGNANSTKNAQNTMSEISLRVGNGQMVYSKDSIGMSILALADTDPRAAVVRMALHAEQPVGPQDFADIHAMYRGLKFDGLDEDPFDAAVQANGKALDQLRAEWDQKFKETAQTFDDKMTKYELRALRGRIFQGGWTRWKKGEIASLEKTFNEKLRLRSAVEYWSGKAADHEGAYNDFNRYFLVTLSATAGILLVTLMFVGSSWWKALFTAFGWIKTADVHSIDALATFLPVLFFVVWGLRYLSKSLTREKHLATDANMRAKMAETFLALEVDTEGGIDEKERILILSALFRPVSGMDGQEAGPPDIVELLKLRG